MFYMKVCFNMLYTYRENGEYPKLGYPIDKADTIKATHSR